MSSFHIWHRILKQHMVTLKRKLLFYSHWGPLCGSYIFQGVEVDKAARQSSSQLIGLRIPNSPHIIESSPCGLKVVSQIYSVCQCYHLVAFIFPMALLRTWGQWGRVHEDIWWCFVQEKQKLRHFILSNKLWVRLKGTTKESWSDPSGREW